MQAKHPKVSQDKIREVQDAIDAYVENNPDEARSSATVLEHFRKLVGKSDELKIAAQNGTIRLRFGRPGEAPRVESIA